MISDFGQRTRSGLDSFGGVDQVTEKTETSFKENMAPEEEEAHRSWDVLGESNALLDVKNNEFRNGISSEDDHPFSDAQNRTTASLLSASH